MKADVADSEQVVAAFEQVRERFGPVLVLVNNAGVREDGLAIRMSADEWEHVVDVNLNGAFHCTRRALDDMLKARWGRVVNVSSVVAERGNPGQANYAAAKAGLLGFTRTLAREMGRKGITVNAVTPGVIETDMTDGRRRRPEEGGPGRPGRAAPTRSPPPISFLVSEDAAYVNGATLAVDGGLGAHERASTTEQEQTRRNDTMANVPNDQDVLGGIREELAAIKVPGAEEAAPESTWNDLDVDSLDLVEVVKALEDRYEIQIADGRLKSIATVGDAVSLVQELVREKEGVSA